MEQLFKALLFFAAVYGLANAIAVLKFGRLLFGIGYCEEDGCPSPSHPKDKRKILGKIPVIGDVFYCPPCVAFWVGMALSWFFFSMSIEIVGMKWRAMIVDGLAASGVVYMIHLAAERLGRGLKI